MTTNEHETTVRVITKPEAKKPLGSRVPLPDWGMTMKFAYVGDDTQICYSEGRSALGEYQAWNGPNGRQWHFMGWLYEGKIRTWGEAKEMTASYLSMGSE